MKRISFLAPVSIAVISALSTASFAGGHLPYEKRQAAMKTVGASTKTLSGYAKGTAPYDAAGATAAFTAMQNAVANLGEMFPEGSEADKSEAGPKIWSDPAGFDAAIVKFQNDIAAAVAAAPASKDAFMPVFGQVAGNCKACHEGYRVKKN